ncbi:MAG: hypothetical protein IJE25_08315 [Clostridia bacterium]|nr:hypothetical protein [Clostridia bacterium]
MGTLKKKKRIAFDPETAFPVADSGASKEQENDTVKSNPVEAPIPEDKKETSELAPVKEEGDENSSGLLGYQDYYDMAKKYAEEYFTRGELGSEGDEIYRGYRDQILKQAEIARRDTVAQASALTGGYASSYANALGAAAANSELDALPAAYEAALARYNEKGEKLLNDANLASEMGDYLYSQSPEYLSELAKNEKFEIEQTLKSQTLEGTNKTVYENAMKLADSNKTEAQIREQLIKWSFGEDETLTVEEVDYLMNEIRYSRALKVFNAMTDRSGNTLQEYIANLQEKGYSGEQVYGALTEWNKISDDKLTEDEIILLMDLI